MKLTNGEILAARESFHKLFELKWPVKVSYKLARLGAELNEQLKLIEDVRNSLIKQHGAPNEKGQFQIKNTDPGWESYVQEWTELLNQETEVPLEGKIKLPDSGYVNIEPVVLMNLEKFIEVE
jgi:hypothetical protein